MDVAPLFENIRRIPLVGIAKAVDPRRTLALGQPTESQILHSLLNQTHISRTLSFLPFRSFSFSTRC